MQHLGKRVKWKQILILKEEQLSQEVFPMPLKSV